MIATKHYLSNVLIPAGVRWGMALVSAGLLASGASAQTLTIQVRPTVSPAAGSLTPTNVFTITTVPQTVTVTANESNPAYAFDRWEIVTNAQFNILADPADPVLLVDVTSTSSPAIVRAWFKSRGVSLIVSANPPEGGYTQNPGLGTNWLATNQVVKITATASNGYEFVNWNGAASGTANPAEFTMSFSQSIVANFAKLWTVAMANWGGPASLITNTFTVRSGTLTNLMPSSVFAGATSTRRSRCNGWTAGTGSVSPTSATGADNTHVYVTVNANSSLSWIWVTQFKVTYTNTPIGYIQLEELASPADNDAGDGWVDSNTSVRVTLVANDPAKYEPDYVLVSGVRQDLSPTYQVDLPVTNAMNLVPVFRVSSQDDPGYIAYMKGFGLVAGSVGQRTFDDPDLDGLSNQEEYRLSNTNKSWYYSPINSDTDGDGMDDAYETGSVDPTNVADQVRGSLRPAATDNGGYSMDNGAGGNPDKDYKWSTTDGYLQPSMELLNIEEYRGPDGTPPWTNVTLNFGEVYVDVYGVPHAYPFASNPSGFRPEVRIRVPVAGDTGDQSKGNTSFTDKDPFDDGFEYSWDQWQQAHSGYEELILVGVTNDLAGLTGVPLYITNTVPVWPGARAFNPGVVSVPGAGPDNDILYDYASGKVSLHYYSADREYDAWKPDAFSPGLAAPHSIRMDAPPTMPAGLVAKRCSNPFLWDVDLDGLPDGYEVIFGYDPWTPRTPGAIRADGDANPDNDWMAKSGTNQLALRNHAVYLTEGFDPRVAVDQVYPDAGDMPGKGTKASPMTERFSNVEEMRGPDGMMALAPADPVTGTDDATNPTLSDSDGDGMWDGWECYVGFNPNVDTDAALDADGDDVSNLEEFLSFYTSSTNREALTPLTDWANKILPTDPGIDPSPVDTDTKGGADTDADGISDGGERDLFNGDSYGGLSVTSVVVNLEEEVYETNVSVYAQWAGSCYLGGGLNPCSSDTDSDTLPDPYEGSYASGLDGTKPSTMEDPDGDGLKNYQEYWSASVYHWQYDVWMPGQPSYDNADFFQGTPKKWDWSQNAYIPLLGPEKAVGPVGYSGSYPTAVDSDVDGMDDFYEIYHGLNPIFGTFDLLSCRMMGKPRLAPFPGTEVGDPRTQPWVAGHPLMDPDGDGLKNFEEAAWSSFPSQSPRTHTDPSPLWMTDWDYAVSFPNLYYRPSAAVWYWSQPATVPQWAFDFECNEGYDTDNDGHSDKEELNVTKTDPLTPERPVKRRALYLPAGVDAYARTWPGYAPSVVEPGGGWLPGLRSFGLAGDALRSFTVEAWVRPLAPASGVDQVVVERPFAVTSGNPMNLWAGIRRNFRLAINADGKPYISYTGEGWEPVYGDVQLAAMTAVSTNWTHLAATYQVPSYTNANEGGVLTLYVNGAVAARGRFSQLPATGAYDLGGSGAAIIGAPVVVGAADSNPSGFFTADPDFQPQPSLFFKGWIDEVRVWDGARSDAQIQSAMSRQLRQTDVLAAQWPNPTLRYLFTFDGLPDPEHAATTPGAPLGFDVTATAIFPADFASGMWANSLQHSQVYTDYRYIPWIENIATHTPELPPVDIGDTNLIEDVMSGTNVVGQTLKAWNTSNPYGVRYITAPDKSFETFHRFNDLLPLLWAQADEDVPMWDNNTVPSATPYDSDGDGMPDTWEELAGLDPLDGRGDNGAYGDLDGDGLNNLAEYRAGTDPAQWDTDGDGFGDYDSRPGPGDRTWGELYDDGDGIPDSWEVQYPGPCPTTGKRGLDPAYYDANLDPDEDGWSNFAEYMGAWRAYNVSVAGSATNVMNTNNVMLVQHCDPLDSQRYPEPLVSLYVRYSGRLGNSLNSVLTGNRDVRISVYHSPSMDGYPDATLNLRQDTNPADGIPDWWNDRYNAEGAGADNDGDLLNNYDEYQYGTDPWNPDTDGDGIQDINDYSASQNQAGAALRRFTTGYIREGNNYVFAYLDVNGDKQWQPDTEPAGIGQFQPVNLGWSDVNNIEIGLTDSMPGYPRFSWPAVANVTRYIVTNAAAPYVGKTINGPKNYWHEGDWLSVGTYGVPTGTVVMLVYSNEMPAGYMTNVVSIVSGGSVGTPTIVTPHDAMFYYARNELEFKVDPNATSYRMQIAASSNGTVILTTTNIVPYKDINGVSKAALPFYAGDNYVPVGSNYASSVWTNGRYWARITAATPATSVSSQWSAFNVDVRPPSQGGKSRISGDLYYFGKVARGYGAGQTNRLTLIVQAFQSPGFSGEPEAQVQVSYTCNTNAPSARKGAYTLAGLHSSTYVVRAFIDMNGNRKLDSFEPMGIVQMPDEDGGYMARVIDATASVGVDVTGMRIIIRDRDTDDDQLPDGWEWMYFGTLAKGAYDLGSNSLTLVRNYEIDPLDLDPTKDDYDGDGVHDTDEITYSDIIAGTVPNVAHYDPFDPVKNPGGRDLNPAKWDTDGDGLSDGYELAHGLDPLNPSDGAAEMARAQAAGEMIPGVPRVSQVATVTPDVGQFTLTWEGQFGMSYQVQFSDDLKNWSVAAGGFRYGAATHTYTDASSPVSVRFYRVVVK